MKGSYLVENRPEAISPKGTFYDWLDSIVFALIVVMIFNLGFRLVNVSGDSMLPTLQENNRLVLSHINYHPQYGDIIVSVQDNEMHEPIIKRVIAVGGQTVALDPETGAVIVDGKALDEPYILEPILYQVPGQIDFPVEVPPGKVFVMGDNRNNSVDSRSVDVGLIEERYILGKVIFRLFPFDRFGTVS